MVVGAPGDAGEGGDAAGVFDFEGGGVAEEGAVGGGDARREWIRRIPSTRMSWTFVRVLGKDRGEMDVKEVEGENKIRTCSWLRPLPRRCRSGNLRDAVRRASRLGTGSASPC